MTAAPALTIDRFEYTETMSSAIKRATDRIGLKGVARAASCNMRSVENWCQGVHTPNGLQLLRLMATVPEVQAEVRRLAAMEADLDPTFERDMDALMRTYWRIKERR